MMGGSDEKESEKFDELADVARRKEAIEEEQRRITQEMKNAWLDSSPLEDQFSIEKNFAEDFKISLSEAKKMLHIDMKKYQVEGTDIPKLVKSLKEYRRTLKGEEKINVTKAIDNLIVSYGDHLHDSINKIYWLKKYSSVLKEMNCSEEDILKLSFVNDLSTRRDMIDTLCKYWEASLERRDMPYNEEYSSLSKQMTNGKREFKKLIKSHMVNVKPKEIINQHILKAICEEPGISSRQIHEKLPKPLFKRTTPSIISKMAIKNNVTTVNGAFYKFSDDIKKDIYAYTAAFIDSDGYITMDRNFNPRVGLVATGDRGKAFMLEMHKSLGCGRLHLDQKSPQNTRAVNRLNFYSAADVTELLTKCLPHFKMKKGNAEILLELVRMKKSHKKAEWYKTRREELFKLMKYENHKDHVGYDFIQDGIDVDNISKLYGNSKMLEMDKLEGLIA